MKTTLCFLCLLLSASFGTEPGAVVDFASYERCVYSQNGEDGVIEKIFHLVGTESQYYVEFGAHDGFLCSNTRYLREVRGWKGLLLDAGFENLEIGLHQEFVNAENINFLLEKYHVPENIDFLSIDIDSNDFYIWQAIDRKYRPKLVVIEYNAAHLPDEDKVIEYVSDRAWDGTNYFGASIKALYNLGRHKGYSLVYADTRGVNLFFVRDDLLEELEDVIQGVNDINEIYRFPQYGLGPNGGYRADPLERCYLSSKEILSIEETHP